ncbi:hypothetical protein HWV62_23034 [Athelia sp. TMB]|nr:hypothetical protein HWV62_23034 [Athelia sp. TMB]
MLRSRPAHTNDEVTSPDQTVGIQWEVVQPRGFAVKQPVVPFQGKHSKANVLKDKSSAFLESSQLEQALAAMEEAVYLLRGLAVEQPAVFNIELASSLIQLSHRFEQLNRSEEALLAIQESVALYRTATEDSSPSHHPGLAAALYTLSGLLSKYGIREEALAAIQEASSLYRSLVAKQPETYSSNLAASLRQLSSCLGGLDRQEDTLVTGLEADGNIKSSVISQTHSIQNEAPIPQGGLGAQASLGYDPTVSSPPGGAGAHTSPTFNTTGTSGGRITNVNGICITGDEDSLAKISRLLVYAEGASWNPQSTCLPGTRISMLSVILAWARQADSKRICWIKGVAGSGKSAILHTIAQILKSEGLLGFSFFFSRDSAARNTPKTLFTTMARDLAYLHPRIAEDIASALEAEPALATASLSRQFDALILEPSRHLPANRPIVLVIDALDEGISHDLDTELLAIIRDKAAQLPAQVRILLTSRPTSIIEKYLSGRSHVMTHSIDIFSVENKRDIDAYVDAQLRNESIFLNMGITSPDEAVIRDLKQLADGLFIWIVTVCSFLRTAYKPKAKLQALLSKTSPRGSPPEKKMDQLYSTILTECGDWEDPDFLQDYDLVMGTIVAAKEPLSLAAMRGLHDGGQELDPELLLQRFGSVLIGFHEPHQPIRVLHMSFREFITDRAAHNDDTKHFHLPEKKHSGRLAELCVVTLNGELAKPIRGAGYLAEDQDDLPGIPKISGVSEELVYGCAHWPNHLQDVERPQMIQSHIIMLLSKHLTAWMEIVTSTGVFRGSLAIQHWLQKCAPELEHHFCRISHASALSLLGDRLSDEFRWEEALLAKEEAVEIYRILAAEQPEVYNKDLADNLSRRSALLVDLGRAHEALAGFEEVVNLYRMLATESPATFNTLFASALTKLSNHLRHFNRPHDALALIQEPANLWRAARLVNVTDADLAASLNNLSDYLMLLGSKQEALALMEEVVKLRRALATQHPAAYNSDFDSALFNILYILSSLDRPQEALPYWKEAMDLCKAVVLERPAAYKLRLGKSFVNLCYHLWTLDRPPAGLPATQKAVDSCRMFAANQPAIYDEHLVDVLIALINHLRHFDRREEALASVKEMVNQLFQHVLSVGPITMADIASFFENLSRRLPDARGTRA